jgi:hypothetical protein
MTNRLLLLQLLTRISSFYLFPYKNTVQKKASTNKRSQFAVGQSDSSKRSERIFPQITLRVKLFTQSSHTHSLYDLYVK